MLFSQVSRREPPCITGLTPIIHQRRADRIGPLVELSRGKALLNPPWDVVSHSVRKVLRQEGSSATRHLGGARADVHLTISHRSAPIADTSPHK
ncbi:hypothetical protein J6590_012042 [Homalodisca vitripennis]|nr:hypothetical protein J6590_012042 [Homalodisca vitripennis]